MLNILAALTAYEAEVQADRILACLKAPICVVSRSGSSPVSLNEHRHVLYPSLSPSRVASRHEVIDGSLEFDPQRP
jgi:hypothetical protein